MTNITLSILICIAYACVWYLPLYLVHRKFVIEKPRYYIIALLLGAIMTYMSIFIYRGFKVVLPAAIWTKDYRVLKLLITVCAVEDILKSVSGILIVRKIPKITEAGCMLIMGMVGLGFEYCETIICKHDLATTALRGLMPLHIAFQMYTGKYIWQAIKARESKNMQRYRVNAIRAIIVPIVVHTIYDSTRSEFMMYAIGYTFICVVAYKVYLVLRKETEKWKVK